MSNYFYDALTPEALARLPYLPTIGDLLTKCEAEYADWPAISNKTTTYTYKELIERVARRRATLYAHGLRDGRHVAVLCRNTLEGMEWYLAVTTAGCTLMMLPNTLDAQALIGVAKKFDIDALIAEPVFADRTTALTVPVMSTEEIADAPAAMAKLHKDTVAAIYFTGGTTGAPKGAVLTHGALMRGALNSCYKSGETFGNRTIAMLPLSHIFGSVFGFLGCLYTGSLIYDCPDMRAAIGDIPVVRPTVLVLVPGLVEIILGVAKLKGAAFLGDLKVIACGAAPVPPRLMKEFAEYHIALLAGYGMTEGANLTSGNLDTATRPESMGHIYPGQDYKVVDGELWIKGDNVMVEYYNDPEKTAEVMEDGWLKTGDLVQFDDEGYITITGRLKNLIILPNGENVSPEEIESAFYKSPLIRDCLVREDTMNDRPVLAIEILPLSQAFEGKTREEIEATLREVVQQVNATLPTYQRVAKITVRETDFKRTGAMKVSRL